MLDRRSVLLASVGGLVAAPALAHHGWGSFDRNATRDITGAVLRSSYANPHGVIVLRHENRDLTFELAPVHRMRARGLEEAEIAPGRTVRLFGYRNTQTPTLYRAEWIEIANRRVELR